MSLCVCVLFMANYFSVNPVFVDLLVAGTYFQTNIYYFWRKTIILFDQLSEWALFQATTFVIKKMFQKLVLPNDLTLVTCIHFMTGYVSGPFLSYEKALAQRIQNNFYSVISNYFLGNDFAIRRFYTETYHVLLSTCVAVGWVVFPFLTCVRAYVCVYVLAAVVVIYTCSSLCLKLCMRTILPA